MTPSPTTPPPLRRRKPAAVAPPAFTPFRTRLLTYVPGFVTFVLVVDALVGDRGLLLPQLLVGAFRIRVPALSQRALACLEEPLRLTGRRRRGAGLRTRRDCIQKDADENPRPETFQIH